VDKLVPKPIHIAISMQGGGGLSNLNENIVYRQGAGRLVTDTWNRIPNFVKQYGKGIVNKILYETTGKTLSDTTREDMTKGEAAALEEAMAEAVVSGKGEFGTLGTDFEGWVGLGEKGNVRRDAEAIVGGATVSWNPETEQYEFKDKYDFPVMEAPGSFRDEVKSINEWLEERGNTRDQIVDPTKGLVGALLGNFFPQNRLFGAGLSLGSKIVGKSENKRYFDENDPEDLDKIRHIPYAGAFHTSMGISPQKVQDISEKHDFFGVKDQSLKRTGEGFGGGAEFGLVGGEASGGYSYDPNTDTTFLDGTPIDTTAAFKHGGQTMPGGLSGINENIVYRGWGGIVGTKLWDKDAAKPKENHNGGISWMMKGDDGRYYTRGGTDQRGLYYPEEVREQTVDDEPALHPADKEDKDIVDYTGAKGPIPFPTSFEIQPPTTRPLPISPVERTNVMKTIPSTIKKPIPLIPRFGTRSETGGETKPAKRNLFNRSLPQPVGDGSRSGSSYPAYDRDLATTELLAARDRGELDANWMTKDWIGQGDLAPGPLYPQGTHDPRGIDPGYISYLQEQGTYDPQNYDRNRYNQAAEALSEANPAGDFYSYEDTDFTGFGMKHGGGISSLNDSININGQPHRLVWVNPKEEKELKRQGGSGRKVLGKPAYDTNIDEWGDYTESISSMPDPALSEYTGTDTATYTDMTLDPGARGDIVEDFTTTTTAQQPSYSGISKSDLKTGKPVKGLPWLGAAGEETAEQDAGARRRYINQHLANYPGGRRDPVTQELYRANEDYDRAIKKYGSSMLETLRNSYAGNQDVFGAMFGHAAKLTQDRLREAYNKEIDKFPEDFVDSEEYRESIVDAVLSDPDKAFEKFGLTDVTKSSGLLPEAKVGERGWRDWVGELATPLAVRGLDALSKGIPAMMDIWGTGKVNGEGVYIKKDGTIIPFKSDTERGNIESGSLRGEHEEPKKLKPRPVQVASAEEVVEEKPSALKRFLDARPETSSLDKLYEDMKARVNPLYNRNIFT